mgnify:CR=1 FL=1
MRGEVLQAISDLRVIEASAENDEDVALLLDDVGAPRRQRTGATGEQRITLVQKVDHLPRHQRRKAQVADEGADGVLGVRDPNSVADQDRGTTGGR